MAHIHQHLLHSTTARFRWSQTRIEHSSIHPPLHVQPPLPVKPVACNTKLYYNTSPMIRGMSICSICNVSPDSIFLFCNASALCEFDCQGIHFKKVSTLVSISNTWPATQLGKEPGCHPQWCSSVLRSWLISTTDHLDHFFFFYSCTLIPTLMF